MNIGIVGLGLIGGSLAKSIKNRTDHTVYGLDINKETMLFASMCGAVDGELTADKVAICDVILIGLRPNDTVEWLEKNAPLIPKSGTVLDMCGVKRKVFGKISPVAKQYGFTYIGGHPMAGKERGGFRFSTDDLFVGASMILVPDEALDLSLLETLKALFTDIGFANLTFTTPEEHDRVIAFTSQLAHIVSSAYVKSPEATMQRGFSAGSFRDMTRVARLDEDMWTELFMDNVDFLEEELDIFIRNLTEYSDALKAKDASALHVLLKEGKEQKSKVGGN